MARSWRAGTGPAGSLSSSTSTDTRSMRSRSWMFEYRGYATNREQAMAAKRVGSVGGLTRYHFMETSIFVTDLVQQFSLSLVRPSHLVVVPLRVARAGRRGFPDPRSFLHSRASRSPVRGRLSMMPNGRQGPSWQSRCIRISGGRLMPARVVTLPRLQRLTAGRSRSRDLVNSLPTRFVKRGCRRIARRTVCAKPPRAD